MKKSDFTHKEKETIQQAFNLLLDDYAHTAHRQKVEIIRQAFDFANQAHNGVRRLSGEPYIMHPLSVARIVVKEIGLGSTSICAALLHDVVEDTEYTTEDIERVFGPKIASIVNGLTKISGGIFAGQSEKQAENFRKLLLTMCEDVRVVLVKLADRLHNMRTLNAQSPTKQHKIAYETLFIYAPLAHRLGLAPIKTELEDLGFKYLHPDIYRDIDNAINANKNTRDEEYTAFVTPIKEKLTLMGYDFTISARVKSVYSVWKKMQAKHISLDDIYDLLAVRIVFHPNDAMSEKDQCWIIYSAITEIYRPHPERIRDWISMPKANGYEALHVTVMGSDGSWVEVQIRSERMHELAEHGLAAHWKYKSGLLEDNELDKWLHELQDVLAHPETDAMAFLDTFKLNLFAHEVAVFTPTGEIKTLPMHATILDFAYALHTHLGEHCIGAKVNHQTVGISYILQSGDQVEVLTLDKQQPQPEWQDIVVTAKARNSLRRYFARQDTEHGKHHNEVSDVQVEVRGIDRVGVLVRILTIVSDELHLNMRSMHVDTEDGHFTCRFALTVYDTTSTETLRNKLQEMAEVEDFKMMN